MKDKELTEATHPGMSQKNRNKMAKNLKAERKEIKSTPPGTKKEYLKNLSKYNATTYNPEKSSQGSNKSTRIARKNNDALKKHNENPSEGKLSKKNFIKMNTNESETVSVSFQSRILQEDAYSMPGSGMSGGTDWKKYAKGAGLGAAALGAAHLMGGGDALDDARESFQGGTFINDTVDKAKNLFGGLKTGVGDMTGSGSETVQPGGVHGQDVTKLKGALETGSGSGMTNLDKVNSLHHNKFRDTDAGFFPWQKSSSESMFGNATPNVTDQDIEQAELADIQKAQKAAMADGIMDQGEANRIQDMMGDRTSQQWFGQSDTADRLDAARERETQLGLDTASKQGHNILLTNDTAGKEEFFNAMKQRAGGIPQQYMGLYKDHLREMAQR